MRDEKEKLARERTAIVSTYTPLPYRAWVFWPTCGKVREWAALRTAVCLSLISHHPARPSSPPPYPIKAGQLSPGQSRSDHVRSGQI